MIVVKYLKKIAFLNEVIELTKVLIDTPYYKKYFYSHIFQKKLTLSTKNLKDVIYRYSPLIDKAIKINGAFVECGVGYGRSLQIITSLLQIKSEKRHIYAFDSFEGFPELTPEDKTGKTFTKKGRWKYIKPRHIREIISEYIDDNTSVNVNIIKGFFEYSITNNVLEKIEIDGGIAFLHLDVDLYKSYKITLEKLWDHVNKNGVIIFDEYHDKSLKKFPGSKKAIDEFLITKGLIPDECIKTDELGKCYLIKP